MLPTGFIHPLQSSKFLRVTCPEGGTLVGAGGALGMRYFWNLFSVEYYSSDTEPSINPRKGFSLIVWHPMSRTDRPMGWISMWKGFEPAAHAFSDISRNVEYWKTWNKTAQQNRKKWLSQSQYEITEAKRDFFVSEYKASKRLGSLKDMFIDLLDRAISVYESDVHLYLLRNVRTREIVAGMATVDMRELSQSRDLMSFLMHDDVPTFAGVALVDHWFAHCKEEGISFPHFGVVWTTGRPRSWKGFSNFKHHFNPVILIHPRSLFRFAWNIQGK